MEIHICERRICEGHICAEYITYIKKEALSVVESLKASKVAATYSHTINALPSAWLSLTTLFGMGRGGTSAL